MKSALQYHHSFLLFIICFYNMNSNAQVKIGSNPAVVNTNSILELEGAGKGVLVPRSNTATITAMTAVPTGMLLFNTTDSALYLKRDTGWVIIPVSKRGVNPTLQSPTYADFYAVLPGDNPQFVLGGTPVNFPQGFSSGGINRINPGLFNLQAIGTYQVMFDVSITESGQLLVVLNNLELPYTVVGRATGNNQIIGMCLITTTTINSVLEIRNPIGSAPITITQSAGGSRPVSAHLLITKLQ